MKVDIKIKKLHSDATIPKQASVEAGGWDVTACEITKIHEDFVICKLGISLQPPTGYKIILVPRSSITKTNWILQNSPGLGDSDYTGEYQFRFRALPVSWSYDNNLVYPHFPYKVGDRIGQIYLEKVININFIESEFDIKERGAGGYGSTGNN